MKKHKLYVMPFSRIYPLYIAKVERKGASKESLDEIIYWLTGYDENSLKDQLDQDTDNETFFAEAPNFNPLAKNIKGLICGIRVEDIEEDTMQKIRYLDKLVDDLAKGRSVEKILSKLSK